MRIIFMGSDDLACPALEKLLNHPGSNVIAVVSQPDRPRGRRLKRSACPLKAYAEQVDLVVLTPEKVGRQSVIAEIEALHPDLIVVAAYGQYISPKILALPSLGAINIHPSLLPKYRGASPIQWTLANGEEKTGVTLLYVSDEMDAGDIICQEEYPVGKDDTIETLKPGLAELGANLLIRTVDMIRQGTVKSYPQEASEATYVPKLKKSDGKIDWTMRAEEIRNRIRGFTPWPSCFCDAPKESNNHLKITKARVESGTGHPGEILEAGGEGLLVATGENALRLLDVQPSGKKPMSGAAYLCGYALKVGDYLG